MLPERYRELLTAYVDGELSARQRRHVARLLHRSAEARRLLERLQGDSRELRAMPRPRLDRDFVGPVLDKVAARRTIPMRPLRRFAPMRIYPAWVGAAVAAAVLLAVGTASYGVFTFLGRPAAPPAVASNKANRLADASDAKPADNASHHAAPIARAGSDAKADRDPASRPPQDEVAHQKPADPNPTAPPDKDEPVFTSEGMELFVELKSVAPSADVPAAFKLRDLGEDAVRAKLLAELQKDAAVRLELPVPDAGRAFDRLQTVLKTHHVDLSIDATAQRRLLNPRARTNYVLYSEELTADEWTKLLQQLGADEKRGAEKKPAESPFDALVARRMTERDHKELSDLLGLDPLQTPPPKETAPLGVDPRKPVSDQTASQVAATLGQGKPGAKQAAEHAMLALPYNPVRPKHDSAEVRRFLDERKPPPQGALRVLLVLRGPTAAP